MSEPYEVGIATPLVDTGKAVLFDIDGIGEEWVPIKGIHDDSEVWEEDQDEGVLVVEGWVARLKGWL